MEEVRAHEENQFGVRRIRRGCWGVHTVRYISYASMCLLNERKEGGFNRASWEP